MPTLSIQALRSHIGKRVRYRGQIYTITELVEDIPALVLLPEHTSVVIQQDAYGNPRKFAQDALLISIFEDDGKTSHSNLAFLEFLCDL